MIVRVEVQDDQGRPVIRMEKVAEDERRCAEFLAALAIATIWRLADPAGVRTL